MLDINKLVVNYCKSIRKEVMSQYIGTNVKPHWYNYPATTVVCSDGCGNHTKGSSRAVDESYYDQSPNLKKKLLELGSKIGGKSKLCKNKIGACAEPHAAKEMIINKFPHHLDKLYFSKARRPRTMEIIKPCKNCKYTFPNI